MLKIPFYSFCNSIPIGNKNAPAPVGDGVLCEEIDAFWCKNIHVMTIAKLKDILPSNTSDISNTKLKIFEFENSDGWLKIEQLAREYL